MFDLIFDPKDGGSRLTRRQGVTSPTMVLLRVTYFKREMKRSTETRICRKKSGRNKEREM
jgi:hypothetical protein